MTSGRNATSAKIGIVEGTSYVGMAFSGPLTVFAANNMGWRAAYAGVGLLALIVAAAALFLRDKSQLALPKTHSAIESDVTDKRPFRLPLISFAASAIGFLLYNFCKAFHSTWLPTILVESYGYTSASAASITFIQSILAPVASVFSGLISAVLLTQGFNLAAARLCANDLRICGGSLARSGSVYYERGCTPRNFLFRGCYINLSAHLERARRHFLTPWNGRPCLRLSQCYCQPWNDFKPCRCRLRPHPTRRSCKRTYFAGGSVRSRYYFIFGRLLGIEGTLRPLSAGAA